MTIWQCLGGLVYTGANLAESTLDAFAGVGGKWIAPVVYNDDAAGPRNLELLPHLHELCAARGIRLGGWFNGTGGDPLKDAAAIAELAGKHGLELAILDLEAAYHYPDGNADLQPRLVAELRRLRPALELGVSTNGLDSSAIWNGRILEPPRSFYDLRIRALPQCYSSYYLRDGHTAPDQIMKWLKANGHLDGNFADATAPNGRGVPLSYVHPTIEATGVEGSQLADELLRLELARVYGLTPGFSLYTLERVPSADWPRLAAVRGRLYLG